MIKALYISLAMVACSAIQPKNIYSNIEGIVLFEYKKHGGSYWPYTSMIINEGEVTQFFSSPSTLNSYDYLCNGNWDAQFTSDTTMDEVLSNPLFQNQPLDNTSAKHIGGEIYYKMEDNIIDSNTIIVAFSIVGSGVFYDEVCEKFKKEFVQSSDCPIKDTSVYKKIFILTKLKTARKLDEKEIKRYNLIKSELSSFIVSRCE